MDKSRAQQAATAISKMSKEELAELVNQVKSEYGTGIYFKPDKDDESQYIDNQGKPLEGVYHKTEDGVKQIEEHETDPALELQVGDYATQHFHMCPAAKTLYLDIENKVEDMDLAVRAAKLQDALFAMEEMALERGATEADVFAAEAVASQIMSMAEMMGLPEEHNYIQGHVERIKAALNGVEEAKAYDVQTPTGKRTMSFSDDRTANDFVKTNTNVLKATPVKETHSVGHIDDEPGMLKQYAFDTAEYAVKLYKLLRHYEQMQDQVDFPNWWQQKVMMAREYMSKATHYLEFETVEPQIDAAVDGAAPEVNLEEMKLADFEKIKKGTKIALKGYGYVKVLSNDGVILKVLDTLGKTHAINLGQYNEKVLSETKATCCGKCGRVHVKGTECKKPYLTGKDHCRYN
jgi:hypothetical protein